VFTCSSKLSASGGEKYERLQKVKKSQKKLPLRSRPLQNRPPEPPKQKEYTERKKHDVESDWN